MSALGRWIDRQPEQQTCSDCGAQGHRDFVQPITLLAEEAEEEGGG